MKILSRILFFFLFTSLGFSAGEKIDINRASLEELVKIIHIGETRARELISLRPFSSLDDLVRIKGIDKKKVEDIKKQGLAWVNPALTPEIKKTKPEEKRLATIAQPFKEEYLKREISKFPPFFLIALILAIFSGLIILILKKKLKIS